MRLIRRIPVNFLGIFILCIIGLIFFYKTLFFGLMPIPSDSLVGLYHPWRDYYSETYPNGVPFKNFLTTDPVRQQIPWRHTVIQEVKEGLLPSWSPYSFGGSPLAANIQSGAWSPFNILFFLFNFPVAWTVLIVCQPILTTVFMFLFLRYKQQSVLASVFGSVVWGFSGFSIAWLTWGTIGHVALWLPVLLLLTDKVIQEKHCGKQTLWILLFVLSNFAQLSAGHAQTSLYVFGLSFIYGIWHIRSGITKQSVVGFIASWLLTFGVTFPVWKPMLDLIKISNRISQTNWLKEGWFFPWQHAVQFIAPDFFGNPTTMNYWGVWNYGEMIGYIGVLGSIFAISILFVKHTKDELFWLCVLGIVCVFMTPNPISEVLFRFHMPVLSSLQPTRLLLVVDFTLSIIASYGFSRFEKGQRKPFVFGLLIIGSILILLWVWSFWTKTSVAMRNLYVPTGLFVVFACLGGAIIRFNKNIRYLFILLVLFIGITVFDVFRFGWKFTSFISGHFFFPQTKTITYLQSQKGPFRVLSVDDRLFAPNTLEYYGIESVSGYDPLFQKRYAQFIQSLEQYKAITDVSVDRMITPHSFPAPLLSLLNVRYVLSLDAVIDSRMKLVFEEGQTKVYENKDWLSRVYFARDVINVKSDEVSLSYISNPTFSPQRETVVLNRGVKSQTTVSDNETLQLIEYKYGNMTIKTDTMQERLLVVLNLNYPGWTACIDGKQTEILSTDFLFMGIIVPEGQHSVRIEYH